MPLQLLDCRDMQQAVLRNCNRVRLRLVIVRVCMNAWVYLYE
jgi:hypothetical protein